MFLFPLFSSDTKWILELCRQPCATITGTHGLMPVFLTSASHSGRIVYLCYKKPRQWVFKSWKCHYWASQSPPFYKEDAEVSEAEWLVWSFKYVFSDRKQSPQPLPLRFFSQALLEDEPRSRQRKEVRAGGTGGGLRGGPLTSYGPGRLLKYRSSGFIPVRWLNKIIENWGLRLSGEQTPRLKSFFWKCKFSRNKNRRCLLGGF